MSGSYDVVIVGAANAALCAAHAAREEAASVLVLEKAPRERAGGNTFFTAGAFRVAYGTLEEVRPRQSFPVGDRFRFFGGLALRTVGGGKGLLAQHLEAARKAGVEVRYGSPVVGLLREGRGVRGVVVEGPSGKQEIPAAAVVLASGGFEADPRMRAQYLGPNWDIAKVRGSEANTGEGIQMALDAGAQPAGHWKPALQARLSA